MKLQPRDLGLDQVFDAINDALVVADLEGTIVLWNPAAEEMFGYRSEEVVGRNIELLVPPRLRERHRAGMQRYRRTLHGAIIDARRPVELAGLHQGGSEFPLELTLSPISGPQVEGRLVLAIFRDLSERKRAEQTIEQEKALLRTLLDNLEDGVAACDAGGRLTFFNRSLRRIHGLPEAPVDPAQWPGYYDLYRADGTTPMAWEDVPLYRALRGEHLRDVEMVVAPRNAPKRSFLANAQPLVDAEGATIGAIVVMHDVTDRLRSEARQRTDVERLVAIIETQKAIARKAFDLAAIKRLIVEQAQRLTGASGAVIELVDGAEMLYDVGLGSLSGFEGLRLAIEKSLSGLSVRTGEVLRSDDTELDPRVDREATRRVQARSLLVVPLTTPERTVGVLKVVSPDPRAFEDRDAQLLSLMAEFFANALDQAAKERDLQARTHELEAANVRLRELDVLKDQFLSILSHELRTPINAITGFGSILDDEVAGPLSGLQHTYLQKMLGGAQALLSLVNDLLDMSRIQAGKFRLDPQPMRFGPLVEEVLETLKTLADLKQQRFVNEVPSELPELVADSQRLRQVLVNLVGNAVKYAQAGAVVRVRASIEGAVLRCEVADNGPGIAAEDLPKLFRPFSQLDMSNTRSAGGVGLGLSISKSLIEAHGGTIGVTSRPGHGSTFWFTVPLGGGPRT